jgi:hypothetical protein
MLRHSRFFKARGSRQNSEVDLDVSVGGEARFFARSTLPQPGSLDPVARNSEMQGCETRPFRSKVEKP